MKTTDIRMIYAVAALVAAGAVANAQSRVDLRALQTPLKDQGNRTTCITFAAIAALEAACRRAGYGSLDLSEEFLNYVGKMNWLHPNWDNPGRRLPMIGLEGPGRAETQVGAFGGGSGVGHVRDLAEGMRVPQETYMPYRPSGYDLGRHPSWTDPHWEVQRNVGDFNLDPANLPRRALTAPRYYSVRSYTTIGNGRDPAVVESALRAGREVVWGFEVRGTLGTTWRPSSAASRGAHAMLIVGYDRTATSSADWVFICKNSWGASNTRSDGFTYVTYDYLRSYGYEGAYITAVDPPAPWPELAFTGRYNLSFDGHRGTLDLYHLPGSRTQFFAREGLGYTDRRLGTFYDTAGNAFRVNGEVQGTRITFWIKPSVANLRWDDRWDVGERGRLFVYRRVASTAEMAGIHYDTWASSPYPQWGGYAIKPSTILGSDGFLQPVFDNGQPQEPENYLGRWAIVAGALRGEIQFARRDDSRVSAARRGTHAGLVATYFPGPAVPGRSFVAEVPLTRPREILLAYSPVDGSSVSLGGLMLSWQRGVVAGYGSHDGTTIGFYAVRLGSVRITGSLASFGSGCTGSAGVLTQAAVGVPAIGETVTYSARSAPAGAPVFLAIGLSRTTFGGVRLPLDLGFLGASGCQAYVSHDVLRAAVAGSAGIADFPVAWPRDPALIGRYRYTQCIAQDSRANPLGLTFSNGVSTYLGGLR